MKTIQIKDRQGDSLEYSIFEECFKLLEKPIGFTCEIGVRDGFGSTVIIDAWRKIHGQRPLVHLGIDPFGNIEYNGSDKLMHVKYDYTNQMKQDMLTYMSYHYPEFNFINLEDSEFFDRFKDGYPIYNENKMKINHYDLVHLDGPHDTENVIKEANFFMDRAPNQQFIVMDDCQTYDLKKIEEHCKTKQFNLVYEGERKAVFSNFRVDKETTD